MLTGTFHLFDLFIFLDWKEVGEHLQHWRPKETHRIPLGGIGKGELMKVANILCISAVSTFFSISATLSMQTPEPRLHDTVNKTLPIARGRNHLIPKIGPGEVWGRKDGPNTQ